MAKLHIYYNFSEGKVAMMDTLKVKIDDKIKLEIKKHQKQAVELKSGTHNVKMYVPWMSGSAGYVDENIEIQNEDLFYYYKLPLVLSQKGHFTQVANENALEKLNKKNKTKSTISLIVVVLVIILLIVLGLLAS